MVLTVQTAKLLQNAASAGKHGIVSICQVLPKTQRKIVVPKLLLTNLPKCRTTFATSFPRSNIIPTIKVLNDLLRQCSLPLFRWTSGPSSPRPTNLRKVENIASRPWSAIQDMIHEQLLFAIHIQPKWRSIKNGGQKTWTCQKGELTKIDGATVFWCFLQWLEMARIGQKRIKPVVANYFLFVI